jgi:hypothetical protein
MAFRSCAGLPSLVLAYGWDATFFALTMCRLLRDAELLESKLGKIDGGQELGVHIINIVTVCIAAPSKALLHCSL